MLEAKEIKAALVASQLQRDAKAAITMGLDPDDAIPVIRERAYKLSNAIDRATAIACKQCRHFVTTEPLSRIWYRHYCKDSPLPKKHDPFDGIEKPYMDNDIGGGGFLGSGEPPYQHCRDVNKDGRCPKFKATE